MIIIVVQQSGEPIVLHRVGPACDFPEWNIILGHEFSLRMSNLRQKSLKSVYLLINYIWHKFVYDII